MKKVIVIVLFIVAAALFWNGCKKDVEDKIEIEALPEIVFEDFSIDSLGYRMVLLSYVISHVDETKVQSIGICYSEDPTPDLNSSIASSENNDTVQSILIQNLNPGTKYYARVYVQLETTVVYGDIGNFWTYAIGKPIVLTNEILDIQYFSAVSGGEVIDENGSAVTSKGVCWSRMPNPTIDDFHTYDGDGIGPFISEIIDLELAQKYYLRAFAINEVGISYGSEKKFNTLTEPITDIEGNIYETAMIGEQIWMAENLRTTTYKDGISIDESAGYYWWYDGDQAQYAETYGALYNWPAVLTNKLCPEGWHVPTYEELMEMKNFISSEGNYGNVGKALKATYGWNSDGHGTDDYGFKALPGGYHHTDYWDHAMGNSAYFWTKTSDGNVSGYCMFLNYSFSDMDISYGKVGASVRCIKD